MGTLCFTLVCYQVFLTVMHVLHLVGKTSIQLLINMIHYNFFVDSQVNISGPID